MKQSNGHKLPSVTVSEKWTTLAMLLLIFASFVYVFTIPRSYLPDAPKNFSKSTFFNLRAFVYFNLYLILIAVLAILLDCDKKIFKSRNQQDSDSFMGALLSLIILIIVLLGLEVIADYLTKNMFNLTIAAFYSGELLVAYVYFRSLQLSKSDLNSNVISKNGVQGFFLGREVRPKILEVLDLKMYINRVANITLVLLEYFLLYKYIWNLPNNKTLIVLSILKLTYSLDGIFFEYTWEKTAEVRQVGFGFACGTYFVYPFLINTFTFYLITNKIEFETWKLFMICVVFLTGYLIYRISNNQKYNFVENPLTPGIESIPTVVKNKKILCSGFWGFVRHPNHLGDILMQCAFTNFMFCLPAFILYVDIIFLIDRSGRDNQNCKKKYGEAWDQYCKKVKYILVPGIY